ncbi:MBL fold metallo-hydrolase [bacterium]|nr:MBL fold metallo-hydrolase [bacterium]
MITLHVLGAGGAVPTAGRGPAAYWLDLDGHGVLVDPGPGALVRLVRQPGAVETVDSVGTVLLSHLHLDHTADLAPLLFAQHSILAREQGELLVAGPPGTGAFVDRLADLYGSWIEPRLRRLIVREVAVGERIDIGTGQATALPAHHPVDRFDSPGQGWLLADGSGHRLAYTGDTGPCADLPAAIAGCDLLLVECSTPDEYAVATHMSPAGVIDLVGNIATGRVVLTHLYPPVAAQAPAARVEDATGVATVAARDGDVFRIPPETETVP